MKQTLIDTANEIRGLSVGVETQAVNLYISNLQKNSLDTIRTLADSLYDYYRKVNDHSERSGKLIQLSEKLYDQTMHYYELNTEF